MARPRVLRHGTYTNGGAASVTTWTLATGAASGVMGKGPFQWLGWYDLRPWQGTPPGLSSDDYRQNVVALESGAGRVRFTPAMGGANDSGLAVNPIGLPTGGALANVQLGSRGSDGPLTWQPSDGASQTIQAVSLMVVALDKPDEGNSWATNVPQTWDQMDAAVTPGNTRTIFQNNISVGPEVLSDLAQGPAATYDLETLGGGARFVGVWAVGYWIGPDITTTQRGAVLNWIVEDHAGPQRRGAATYAFPVRRIANTGVATSAPMPSRTVAQWSFQRFGNHEILTGASGGSSQGGGTGCSVVVVNGGVALEARVDYHVATAVDQTASPVANMTAVAAGTATTPTMLRLRNAVTGVATSVNPPYSYASLVLTCGVGADPPNNTDTVAMVLVTVG